MGLGEDNGLGQGNKMKMPEFRSEDGGWWTHVGVYSRCWVRDAHGLDYSGDLDMRPLPKQTGLDLCWGKHKHIHLGEIFSMQLNTAAPEGVMA